KRAATVRDLSPFLWDRLPNLPRVDRRLSRSRRKAPASISARDGKALLLDHRSAFESQRCRRTRRCAHESLSSLPGVEYGFRQHARNQRIGTQAGTVLPIQLPPPEVQ